MANISYPDFGKVKTIVLPIPGGDPTIAEYKEQYGIDLREILAFSSANEICIKAPNAQLLISTSNYELNDVLRSVTTILSATFAGSGKWLYLFYEGNNSAGYALGFNIPEGQPLSLDEIQVKYVEV